MVEHCQTHPGVSVRTLSAPRKCQWGPQNCPKTAFFGPKWPQFAISSPSSPKWGFWAKNDNFERLWGPRVTLFGGPKGPNRPPGMCLTMFNHVQPMFNPFGLAGTAYGQIWPFWVKKGRFRALLRPPTDISGWAKRPKLTPPEVENIIQPCSPNVQPIWGCRDCLWPNMAFFSLKKAILGGSRAPQ